jgi:PhnB protein
MQMSPYFSFRGNCEAALEFYADCLDARIGELFRYAGSPMAGDAPADWGDKIMHGHATIGECHVMVADVAPDRYEVPKGFSLSLQITTTAEADRIFGRLAEGGTIVMPLAETFWAARFGMVVDRFGIPWLINCEGPGRSDDTTR